MRVGLVELWLRAAQEDPRWGSAREILWPIRLLLDEIGVLTGGVPSAVFVAPAVAELAVPPWAEIRRPTS